ncbi:MAG: bifunctional oligoribonuclease/PAP phosphatase NrnA [Clostridia bacterium]|nr:bifunctional oligoribonuclease/PAP phosphatase NrnA [Clostridia bacterium]
MDKVIELIKKSESIALFSHTKPDPDAIGSVGALQYALKQLNKKVTVFFEDKLTLNLDFFKFENLEFAPQDIKKFDLAIALDVADIKLLNKFEKYFSSFKNSICIDHHLMRGKVSKLDFVNTSACATAEILFDLLMKMNLKITSQIASCLYTGIAGDTGRFLHNNTNARSFEIAKILVDNGAKINYINNNLFKKTTKEMALGMKILLNNLDFRNDVLFSSLSLKEYRKEKIKPVASSELIGFLAGIENINIIIVFNEKGKNEINASLRSTENYDISIVAKHFGGGGHKQASGLQNFKGNLNQAKEQIYDFIIKNIDKIKIK